MKSVILFLFLVIGLNHSIANDDCYHNVLFLTPKTFKKEPTDLYLWLSDVHISVNRYDKVEFYNRITANTNEREYFIVAPIFFCIRSGMYPAEILQLHGGANVRVAVRIMAQIIEELIVESGHRI